MRSWKRLGVSLGILVGGAAVLGGSATGCASIVHADSYVTHECATNLDCIGAHAGDPNWICRKSDHTCHGLLSGDCQTVLGADNLKNESAVLWGALFALNGANTSTGVPQLDALKMAYSDFATAANGLPPATAGGVPRPITVLVCDDSATNDVALRSVSHMVDDLGIQAIVGPAWSGPTLNFLTQKTVPKQVLVIGAGTTSPDFTTVAKANLFYRTCESASLEAPALAKLSENVEAQIGEQQQITGRVKLAIPYRGDSYGKGMVQVLLQNLTLNGLPLTDPGNSEKFLQIDYGNPADPATDPLKYTDTVNKIVALQPNIIITIGTGEMFGNIMNLVEQQWSAAKKPYWIYPETGISAALSQQLRQTDTTGDLRKRIVGTTYGSLTPTYAQFRTNYIAAQFPDGSVPDSLNANTTYDAFYTLVFAAASAGSQPLTGPNLATGIANLVPPGGQTQIHVGPQDINQALTLLTQGQKIDLVGTSGPLDFDLTTGDVKQENQAYCIPLDKSGQPGLGTFSGYGFDLNYKAIGTMNQLNTTCGVSFAQ